MNIKISVCSLLNFGKYGTILKKKKLSVFAPSGMHGAVMMSGAREDKYVINAMLRNITILYR